MPDDKSQSRRIYVGLQEGVCAVSGQEVTRVSGDASLPWPTHPPGYPPAPWLEDEPIWRHMRPESTVAKEPSCTRIGRCEKNRVVAR